MLKKSETFDISVSWRYEHVAEICKYSETEIVINQSDMTGRESYITAALATTPTSSDSYIGVGEGAMANPGYLQSADKMNPFWEKFYKQDGSQQADGLGLLCCRSGCMRFSDCNSDPRKLRFFQPINIRWNRSSGKLFWCCGS